MDLETRSTEKIEKKEVTDNFQSKLGCCLGELLPSLYVQKKRAGYPEDMSKCFLECVSSLLSLQVTEQWKWNRLQKIGVC